MLHPEKKLGEMKEPISVRWKRSGEDRTCGKVRALQRRTQDPVCTDMSTSDLRADCKGEHLLHDMRECVARGRLSPLALFDPGKEIG